MNTSTEKKPTANNTSVNFYLPVVLTHKIVLVCIPDPHVLSSSCVLQVDQFPAIHMYLQKIQKKICLINMSARKTFLNYRY